MPCHLYGPEHHHGCWLRHPGSAPAAPGEGFEPNCHQIKGGALSRLPQHTHSSGPALSQRVLWGAHQLLRPSVLTSSQQAAGSWVPQPLPKLLLGNPLEFSFSLLAAPPQHSPHRGTSLDFTPLRGRVKLPPSWCTRKGLAWLRRWFFSSSTLEIKRTEKAEAQLSARLSRGHWKPKLQQSWAPVAGAIVTSLQSVCSVLWRSSAGRYLVCPLPPAPSPVTHSPSKLQHFGRVCST